MHKLATSDPGRGVQKPGRWSRHGVEIGAALLLALGALAGLALWAEWGFLIAFDAVVTYCFR